MWLLATDEETLALLRELTEEETGMTGFIKEFGFPVAMLIIFLFFGWRIGKYLGVRLFHEDTGLVSRAVEGHLHLVERMENAHGELTKSVSKMSEASEIAKDQLLIISSSRDNLQRAAEHAVDYLEQVAKALNIEENTKPQIDAIRRELSHTS